MLRSYRYLGFEEHVVDLSSGDDADSGVLLTHRGNSLTNGIVLLDQATEVVRIQEVHSSGLQLRAGFDDGF